MDVAKIKANLRVAVAGGSALPVEVHKDFEKKFGVTILEGYGLSETSPVASFSTLGEPVRVGSIGLPIPGVEMKLIQPDSWDEVERTPDAIGEIAIKGHNIMKGYYGRPDATDEAIQDGWFRSGDLGAPRRGRLVLHRRPVQGHDHPRRLQRVPARDRRGPDVPPGRLARRRRSAYPTRATARRSRRS